jgi:predicted pyridoxine 5'-phosphate oxidase superfamily flavin-nucleotide-binding protein
MSHPIKGDIRVMAVGWWHEGELTVQRQAGVTDHTRLRNGVRDELPPHFQTFLAVQRFIVLATEDSEGQVWCSVVAGWPGFAAARDTRTVDIDARSITDQSIRAHILARSRIGLLAFDPSTRRRIRINGRASLASGALTIRIDETFGNCQQYIQRRPADGPAPTSFSVSAIGQSLTKAQQDWIRHADTCFIASSHPEAGLDVSHRGGRPGFISVVDARKLEFRDYPGNNMFQTLGNLTENPRAALLFIDFGSGATLQLVGIATIHSTEMSEESDATGRKVAFAIVGMLEKQPREAWRWPVLEYSAVNPRR